PLTTCTVEIQNRIHDFSRTDATFTACSWLLLYELFDLLPFVIRQVTLVGFPTHLRFRYIRSHGSLLICWCSLLTFLPAPAYLEPQFLNALWGTPDGARN